MVGNHVDCRVLARLTAEHLPALAAKLKVAGYICVAPRRMPSVPSSSHSVDLALPAYVSLIRFLMPRPST